MSQHVVVAEWSRAPAYSSRVEGDVGLSPSPAKITFSDEIFLNNSRVYKCEKIGNKLSLIFSTQTQLVLCVST